MRLRYLRAEGFRGIREPLEIVVPDGFLVITGRNGSGKSSVCDLIEFALTGTLRRFDSDTERRERIADYMWWRGEQAPIQRYVSVGFIDDEGREFEIRRDPSGRLLPESDSELVEAFCDISRAPTNPLERILATAVIRDEEITRWSIDLSETERFRFVRAAIGESELPEYVKRLQDACNALNGASEQYENDYRGYRAKIDALVEQISERQSEIYAEKEIAEAKAALKEYLSAEAPYEVLIARARSQLVTARASADRLFRFADELEANLNEQAEVESPEYHDRLHDLEARKQELGELLLEANQETLALGERLDALEKAEPTIAAWAEILELGERIGRQDESCPLCGSVMGGDQYMAHIAEKKKLIERKNREVSGAVAAYSEAEENERRLRSLFHQVERELRALSQRSLSVVEQRNKLQAELEMVVGQAELDPERVRLAANNLRLRPSGVERAIAVLESSKVVEQLEVLQASLAEARENAAATQKSAARVTKAHEKAKAALVAVRRLERELVSERLAALGPLLEELYLRLRPHFEWTHLRYHVRGDVQHFLSLMVGEDLNPRFVFSSGQRRAIGIAFLLAVYLSTDWSRMSTVMLDDPVQHIDDYRALHLVELLSSLRKSGRQIVCTVEDPALAELLARRLRGIQGEMGALATMQYEVGKGAQLKDFREILPLDGRILMTA